jgi:hypothetical protein
VQILESQKNKLIFLLICFCISSSCSVTQTRPVQEMADAEAALNAAKSLHADILVPELYRVATESFYKAKREYRLKNFEEALQFALKTIKLSEKAEFEAYLKGGASPEAMANVTPPEGASADPEMALANANALRKEKEEKERQLTLERLKKESHQRELENVKNQEPKFLDSELNPTGAGAKESEKETQTNSSLPSNSPAPK